MRTPIDWNEWLTVIAALALIVAIVIPFAQKKYEAWKSKISFNLYLKKYFGILFNALTYDRIEYTKPSIKDSPEKVELFLLDYLLEFEKDFKEYQNVAQYRIAFTIVFNLQNLFFVIHRIQNIIGAVDTNRLYEQTLAYGNSLSKKELNRIYAVLLLMEHFTSITSFHDRFINMKSIKREVKDGNWVGLRVEQSLLKEQHLVFEDVKQICNEEASLQEVIKVTKLLIQELKGFYQFEKLMNKRRIRVN